MPTATKTVPQEIVNGTLFDRAVPIEKMFVAYRDEVDGYARPKNAARAKKLITEFDLKAVGPILLSLREDGTFAIIDGQHRVDAAEANGITALDAYIYIDLTVEQEAELYAKFGDYLKQSARDKHFAALVAGDKTATAIDRVCADLGFVIPTNTNSTSVQNYVQAVSALYKTFKNYGESGLRDALALLRDAYNGNPHGYVGSAISGAAAFLARFGSNRNFNRGRLINRMQRGGPMKLESLALNVQTLDRGDKPTAFGKAMLALHDQGFKEDDPRRLGAWIGYYVKPEMIEVKRATMAAYAASPNGKTAALEGAKLKAAEAACRTCGAKVGEACIGTAHIHQSRVRDAAAQRAAAKKATRNG